MKLSKGKIFQILFFVVVLLLTMFYVFKGQNLEQVLGAMAGLDTRYLIYGALAVCIFIFVHALIIFIMLRTLGIKQNVGKCILYAFTGYFYCNITPFAIGGPPMQVVYMKKQGVPVSVSSIVMMIITFMYKATLVVVGAGMIIFGQRLIRAHMHGVLALFGVGMFMTAGFCFLLFMFTFHTRFASFVMRAGFGWLEKKHILKPNPKRTEKFAKGIEKYKETSVFFMQHKVLMVIVFLLTMFQRFVLFSVTYFVYRALGLSGTSLWTIVILQASISLAVDILPVPGGIGLSEFMFSSIFKNIFGASVTWTGMVLSRGMSYYVQLIVCAGLALVTHFVLGKSKAEKKAKKEAAARRHSGNGMVKDAKA